MKQEPEGKTMEAAIEARQAPRVALEPLRVAGDQTEEAPLPDWLRESGDRPQPPTPPGAAKPNLRGLLRDSALAMVISFALLLASAYVPLLGVLALLLLPLPWAALILRHGLAAGSVVILLFGVAAFLVLGLPAALRIILQYGLLGWMFGVSLRRWHRPLLALGLSLIIAAIGALGSLSLALQWADPAVPTLSEQIEAAVNDSFALLEEQGMADQMLPGNISLEQMRQQITGVLQQMLPAIAVMGALIMAFISCLLMLPLLRRLGFSLDRLPRFSEWRLDWRLTWVLIIGLLCYLSSNYFSIPWLHTVGLNILYIIVPVFLVCGLSFVIWLFRLEGFSLLLKIALAFVLIFFAYFGVVLLLVLVGLDSMLDLRSKMLAARDRSRGE